MVREQPRDRYQKVAEVLEALNTLPFDLLFYGRELRENETVIGTWHVTIDREIENAFGTLLQSNSENVLERLRFFENKLDQLGDARDNEADAIMRVTGNILGIIDSADRDALLQLVQRFVSAVEDIPKQVDVPPVPDMWSHFLADAFRFSSHPETKYLCLKGLVEFLDRFGTSGTKYHLYQTIEVTIENIEDPNYSNYMKYLIEQLRAVEREDIADLLDGVPEQRTLDLDALRIALSGFA
jgi:hypothetical protein